MAFPDRVYCVSWERDGTSLDCVDNLPLGSAVAYIEEHVALAQRRNWTDVLVKLPMGQPHDVDATEGTTLLILRRPDGWKMNTAPPESEESAD